MPLGLTAILLLNIFGLWLPRLKSWPHHALGRSLRLLLVILCAASLAVLLTNEGRFWLAKRAVFTSDRSQLERLGQHFIVGYRRFEELQTLVDQGGIGGIFIARRNLEEQTPEELQQAIADLQALRQRQNLPPLWIATDQEGGVVSRLSPPLTQLPPLATWWQNPPARSSGTSGYASMVQPRDGSWRPWASTSTLPQWWI